MQDFYSSKQFWITATSEDIHVGLKAPGLYEAISPKEARKLADALNRAADEVDPKELQLPASQEAGYKVEQHKCVELELPLWPDYPDRS